MLTLTFSDSILTLPQTLWNEFNREQFPFLRYEFLAALEQSGSLSKARGWQAQHLVLKQDNEVLGFIPAYLKNHSYGEYVFDFQWAEAYHRHGLPYYPKLISAIPFSPVSGPRILCSDTANEGELLQAAYKLLPDSELAKAISSWHILFLNQQASNTLRVIEPNQRRAVHFKWLNKGYKQFDDFLNTCTSRHRKNIRKERQKVKNQGITLRTIEGEMISEHEWQLFYHFYQATYLKRSGHGGYLTPDFFKLIKDSMPQNLMLVLAEKDQEAIAGALYFKDKKTLYGRYWGSLTEDDCLHFEACYYQGIEYCIQHGLMFFDPGVQGEHKLKRGFEPYFTYSNHWVKNPGFRDAIYDFLVEERPHIDAYYAYTREQLPYKSE